MNYWFDIVRFARQGQWEMAGIAFGEMWCWAEMNADCSHDERPWSFLAQCRMYSELYPDDFPF